MRKIPRPAEGEYAPHAIMYIGLIPDDGAVLKHMKANAKATKERILEMSPGALTARYAEGKWTVKEIVAHLSDDERIYAYRALRFARNDRTELPGFEEKDYARYSGANDRSIQDLLKEFAAVRQATISLFEGLPEESFLRRGIANGSPMSVRAAAYHIAGHELHHRNIIETRYAGL